MQQRRMFLQEEKDEAVRLYLERRDLRATDIYAWIGCAPTTLSRWLRESGVTPGQRAWSPHPPEKQDAVVRFFLDNPKMLTSEICERFGIERTTLFGYLKRRGVDPGPRRCATHYSEEDIDKAVRMYQDGLYIDDIAATIGCSHNTLARWLKRRGVPMDRNKHRTGRRLRAVRRYYPEFKVKQALNMYMADKPIREIIETVGCTKDSLYDWVGAAGLPRDRRQRGVGWEGR